MFFIGAAIFFAISPFVPSFVNPYLYQIVIYAGINITLAVSLNLVNGLTGQFSMGHAGFMSVGAYVSCYLTTTYFSQYKLGGVPPAVSDAIFFALALYLGGLFAAVLGFVVGLPSLRLKGDYLA